MDNIRSDRFYEYQNYPVPDFRQESLKPSEDLPSHETQSISELKEEIIDELLGEIVKNVDEHPELSSQEVLGFFSEFLPTGEEDVSLKEGKTLSPSELKKTLKVPLRDAGLKVAGNYSLGVAVFNTVVGLKAINKIEEQIQSCQEEIEELKKSQDADPRAADKILYIESRIYDFRELKEEFSSKISKKTLKNMVLSGTREASRAGKLLSFLGVSSKLAIIGNSVGLLTGGLRGGISAYEIKEQNKKRQAITKEVESLKSFLETEEGRDPLLKNIAERRMECLFEQYEKISMDTLQSSLLFASSSISVTSSVIGGLALIGVAACPPALIGAAVIGSTVLTTGVLVAGAAKTISRHSEKIGAVPTQLLQATQAKVLQSAKQKEASKLERLQSESERLKETLESDKSKLESIVDKIALLESEKGAFKQNPLTGEVKKQTKASLSGLLNTIQGKISLTTAKREALIEQAGQIASLGLNKEKIEKLEQLREELSNAGSKLFFLGIDKMQLEEEIRILDREEALLSLQNKQNSLNFRIFQRGSEKEKIEEKIASCLAALPVIEEKQKEVSLKQKELKEKVRDITRSKKLGISLGDYTLVQQEIEKRLVQENAYSRVHDFLVQRSVDLTAYEDNPLDSVMGYITASPRLQENA